MQSKNKGTSIITVGKITLGKFKVNVEGSPFPFKNNGKRNRIRGHSYERKIAQEFREMGWEKACTTRYASRMRDDQKVDIFDVEPFNVQCKATNKCINYKQVLSEMPNDNNYNVVFNKLTGKGDFVIMAKEDFYELVLTLKKEGIL